MDSKVGLKTLPTKAFSPSLPTHGKQVLNSGMDLMLVNFCLTLLRPPSPDHFLKVVEGSVRLAVTNRNERKQKCINSIVLFHTSLACPCL